MPQDTQDWLPAAAAAVGGGLLGSLLWFAIWVPLIAVLEYATHRWIMHRANRVLDPQLAYLKNHGSHHLGDNGSDYVDVPVTNCLLLLAPAFLLLALWGLVVGPLSAVLIPSATLLAWGFVYSYLWTRIHRAIHGTEENWVQRAGWLFRFYRDHHLKHHAHMKINYGTVFPVTDYLFFTWFDPKNVNDKPTGQNRPALAELVNGTTHELHSQAEAVADAIAPEASPDARKQLAATLEPAAPLARRGLSRPADPEGKAVPSALRLDSPRGPLPFVPPAPPRLPRPD